jgi:hypothetical protein
MILSTNLPIALPDPEYILYVRVDIGVGRLVVRLKRWG